jgi:hypothetical protein
MFTESGKKVSLEGSWLLYDISPMNESGNDFSTSANLQKQVKEGSILSFFEDKTYSETDGSGKFYSGNWLHGENKNYSLINQKSSTKEIHIRAGKNKQKKINSLEIEKKDLIYKYIKTAEPLKKPQDDPFHPLNNQWRIKSIQPESTNELYVKMAGYIKHLALVLKSAQDRKQDVVSFGFSLGPVKIYNGAIGIYPYEIVPQEWKNSFYNDSTALAAYSIFKNYLKTTSYKGAGVGEWIEDDYNILLSIYADFIKSSSN